MCRHDAHHDSPLDGGHLDPDQLTDAQLRERGMTRRTAIGAAGAGGVALLFAGLQTGPAGTLLRGLGPDVAEAAATSCVMTPAKTVGPYFVDERLDRSDVRADTASGAVQAGVPLTLRMYVFDADADCAPVRGATVDIWHANAAGRYSDVAQEGTSGQNWLRGFQTTDADGLVTFTTIWPGWYSGRAVHIHFKVRVSDGTTTTLEFTSQMFFTDAMNNQVFTTASPYKERSPQTPDTPDGRDSILGGDAATLTLNPTGDVAGGFTADFSVGVSKQTSQVGNTSSGGGAGGPRPGQTTTTTPSTGATTTTTTVTDTSLLAALKATTMLRTALGARRLRLKIKTKETITVTARLSRGGRTIATRRTTLRTGTRYLRLAIPAATNPGAAKLRLTLTDAAGNARTYTRNVHVARRARS